MMHILNDVPDRWPYLSRNSHLEDIQSSQGGQEYKISSVLVKNVYEKWMAEIHGQRSRSTMSRPRLSVFVMPECLSMIDTFG